MASAIVAVCDTEERALRADPGTDVTRIDPQRQRAGQLIVWQTSLEIVCKSEIWDCVSVYDASVCFFVFFFFHFSIYFNNS